VATGSSPHDNQLRGGRLYNTSIGNVGVPGEGGAPKPGAPSPYQMTIADAATLKVLDHVPFTNGVRPWRFWPDGKGIYAQFSNEHAVTSYDLSPARW
jgi:hypothetical protein